MQVYVVFCLASWEAGAMVCAYVNVVVVVSKCWCVPFNKSHLRQSWFKKRGVKLSETKRGSNTVPRETILK